MSKQLSQVGETQLSAKTVKPTHRIHINEILLPEAVIISYNYSANMQYGASSLICEILNNPGAYSPDNPSSPFQFGTKIELWEGLDTGDSADEFKKFTGIIRQVEAKKAGRNSITVTAMDYIVRLEDLDLEYTFEAATGVAADITLTPVEGVVDPSATYICDTFNSPNPYWSENPPPVIKLIEIADQIEDVLFDGFEVHKTSGQVVLGTSLNKNNVEVHASYTYYTGWLYVEDAIRTIITRPDGYGATPFTDSNMTQTFQAVEGAVSDYLTTYTNSAGTPINGDTTDHVTYLFKNLEVGDTTVYVLSAAALPNTSGYILIEDEYISYAGKSGNTLTGCTRGVWGSTATKHYLSTPMRQAWEAKRLWYLSFSNLTESTTLTSSDFIGLESKFSSVDKRYGRIILTSALTGTSPTCTSDYSFYTIQATGVSFVYTKFTQKDVKNRFDAIQAFRKILPPNYILKTLGDGKIWGQFLSQKITADYTLKLATSLSYAQDADIYTRAVVFGKNAAPVSINGQALLTGFNYSSQAVNTALTLEKDTDPSWHILSTINCHILLNPAPVLYMNGLRLDDTPQLLQRQPISKPQEVWGSSWDEVSGTSSWLSGLKIKLPHKYISPEHPIILYTGTTPLLEIPSGADQAAYDAATPANKALNGIMNYEDGKWFCPGSNPYIETIKTADNADYTILFAKGAWVPDSGMNGTRILAKITAYNPIFKLSKKAFPDRKRVENAIFTADFTYRLFINITSWEYTTDRRSDTKWQTLWSAEPPSNLIMVTINLGEVVDTDLIDILAGFYTTGKAYQRRYAFTNTYSLQYSLNGTDYYYIGKDTSGFSLPAGDTVSFDSGALGEGFQTKYLRLLIDKAEKVNYGATDPKTGKIPDAWLAALTEIRIYKNTILKGECKLTPTESQGQQAGWLYDPDDILTKAGDIVYKISETNDYLDTQEKVNDRAKGLLREFYKNHTKAQVDIVYHPSITVGDTVTVVDSLNNINRNYFVEALASNNGRMSLTLGHYPI